MTKKISNSLLQIGTYVKLKNHVDVYKITKRWYPSYKEGTKTYYQGLRLELNNDVEVNTSQVEKIIVQKTDTIPDNKSIKKDNTKKEYITKCGYPAKVYEETTNYYIGAYKPNKFAGWIPVRWDKEDRSMVYGRWSNSLDLVEKVKPFFKLSYAMFILKNLKQVNYFNFDLNVPEDTIHITTDSFGQIFAHNTNVKFDSLLGTWVKDENKDQHIATLIANNANFKGDWTLSKQDY